MRGHQGLLPRVVHKNKEANMSKEYKAWYSARLKPNPDSKLIKPSHTTTQIKRKRPAYWSRNVKNYSGVIQHEADSAVAASYDEQKLSIRETRNASSCQHDVSMMTLFLIP